jgi:hypothetical protein
MLAWRGSRAATARLDARGRHPHDIHGLSHLRAAQWQVDHRRPADGEGREDERVASDEVSIAIRSVTDAASLPSSFSKLKRACDEALSDSAAATHRVV